MENNVVKAFRQRLKRGGFTDISIYDQLNGVYVVSFRDKDGKRDRREMTETQMRNTPHLVWFDQDTGQVSALVNTQRGVLYQ